MHRTLLLLASLTVLAACAGRPNLETSGQPTRRSCEEVARDTSRIFAEHEVDQRARQRRSRPPRTPQELLEIWQPQEARVEVVVDTAGAVEPCSVRLVNTTNRAWGVEIEQWARGVRFDPARAGGHPVRARVSLPLSWRPTS